MFNRLCCVRLSLGVSLAFGIIFIALGISAFFFMPPLITNAIKKSLYLENGTDGFETWQNPPVTVYMSFYVFDLQNSHELAQNPSAKPVFTQLGPFTYIEERPHNDLKLFPANSTLSYRQPRTFTRFVPELSKGGDPMKVKVTTINIPLVYIARHFYHMNPVIRKIFQLIYTLLGETLFSEHTVAELIFGYKEPAISKINPLLKLFKNFTIDENIRLIQNNSDDGIYNIFTGRSDSSLLNAIHSWNYNTSLSWWATPYARMINGTDGSQFGPGVGASDQLYVFSSDICRSMRIEYESTQNLFGIRLLRFAVPDRVFTNPYEETEDGRANRAFCTPGGTLADCHHQTGGVLNISVCTAATAGMPDLPIMMSNPHFYQAAQQYLDAVSGLRPEKDKHQTFIDIEPNTGAALNVAKRLQVNLWVEPMESVDASRFLSPNGTVFPIMWLEEHATINQTVANMVKLKVLNVIDLLTAKVPTYVLLFGALLVVVVMGYASMCSRRLFHPEPQPSATSAYQPIAQDSYSAASNTQERWDDERSRLLPVSGADSGYNTQGNHPPSQNPDSSAVLTAVDHHN